MKRVLHVVMGMDRGGIETFIMNVYRKIDRRKVQFDFLVHTKEKKSYDDEILGLGGRIYSVSPRSQGVLKNRRELLQFFNEHKEYDVVHQHVSSLTYVEPLRIAQRLGVPVRIIHGHSTKQGGYHIHKFIHHLNQLSIEKLSTHYFACSEAVALWMYGKNQRKKNTYFIVKNGIDAQSFIYDEKLRGLARKKYNVSSNVVLGHVGRFSYPKNHEFIIEVFEAVKKLDERASLLLVGDGRLRSQIADKVKAKGLHESVVFTGVISDIPAVLNAMDVFLFPSRYEGLGMAAIEAQATGLPCFVSTEVPEEVAITDNVMRIPLGKSPSEWAQEILKCRSVYERKSETDKVITSGYDVNEVTRWLEELYLGSDEYN